VFLNTMTAAMWPVAAWAGPELTASCGEPQFGGVAAFVVVDAGDVEVVLSDDGVLVDPEPVIGVEEEVGVEEAEVVEDALLLDPLHATARAANTATMIPMAATGPSRRADAWRSIGWFMLPPPPGCVGADVMSESHRRSSPASSGP